MDRSDQVAKADRLLRKVLIHAARGHKVKCVTCSHVDEAQNMTVGHFLGRTRLSVRFDEMNVSLQCSDCNFMHQGRPKEFEAFLRRVHGDTQIDDLIRKGNRKFEGDLGEIIVNLQNKLKC